MSNNWLYIQNCKKLTSINIPDGVKEIVTNFVCNCSSLPSIVIPNSVEIIGQSAFSGCKNITSINIPNSVIQIKENAFAEIGINEVEIPSSVEVIERQAFAYTKLSTVTLPVSLKEISADAFAACDQLTEMHFQTTTPPIVTDIYSYIYEELAQRTLYIPKGSLSTYQADKNWNSFWSKFRGIVEE